MLMGRSAWKVNKVPYQSTDEIVEKGVKALIVVMLSALFAVGFLLYGHFTTDAKKPAYDYAGPDGTLTGVPYQLRNYVVVDHDTDVYYFLIQDPETGSIALCPRLESDGTPWQKPTYEGGN